MRTNTTQTRIAEIVKKAPKISFSNLPFATQKVLVNFMAIRGDAWSDLISENLWELGKWDNCHWRLVIGEVEKKQGSKLFKVFEIPTTLLTEHIYKTCLEVNSDHDSWQEYHEWYLCFDPKSVAVDTQCCPPCIYMDNEDVMEDGWDTLHSYVALDSKSIPLVGFCL
ncbi:hypothetical protein AB6D11_06460 [Vibrio splendidus]